MRVLRLIKKYKKYLKSRVMEKGVICKTEEGSPQGGPLSPLLANLYLNEFDWEMNSRGVKLVRYADDIVVLAKSKRAAERLLESCRKYLEGRLKLKMNTEKSKEAPHKAQPWTQCPSCNAGSESVHPWLDRLLSSSGHEADADVLG